MYVSPITDALINILSDVWRYDARDCKLCSFDRGTSIAWQRSLGSVYTEHALRLCRMKNAANCMTPMKKHYRQTQIVRDIFYNANLSVIHYDSYLFFVLESFDGVWACEKLREHNKNIAELVLPTNQNDNYIFHYKYISSLPVSRAGENWATSTYTNNY